MIIPHCLHNIKVHMCYCIPRIKMKMLSYHLKIVMRKPAFYTMICNKQNANINICSFYIYLSDIHVLDFKLPELASVGDRESWFIFNLVRKSKNFFFLDKVHLSLVLRKPVFRVSDQVPHKPGCTAIEDG